MNKIIDCFIKYKKSILIGFIIFLITLLGYFYIRNITSLKLELMGNKVVKLEYNEEYKEAGFKASLKGKDLTSNVVIKSNLNNKKLGTYEIKYTIKNGKKEKEKIRKIKVVDTTKPDIKLNGENNTYVCSVDSFNEKGFTATDNYDGDITSKVTIKKEKNKIIYKVTDSNNNTRIVERILIEKDIEKPEITLIGAQTIYVKINQKYNELGVKAIDNCDNDITSKVEIQNNVDTSKIGNYSVVYEVKDKAGNKASISRNVMVVKEISNDQNITGAVYLTFDDGPSKTITPALLDILKEKNVKATFFVIHHDNLGYLIKRAHDEGHTIALHSYTHNYQKIYSSDGAFYEDLEKISKEVEDIIGVKSYILRFPGGGSNTISRKYNKGIMSRLTKEVISKGYRYYDWNVSSGDAGSARTKQDVYRNVTSGLVKNRNNIVLMHDFNNNYKTLNAIGDIIDYARNKGYVFKTIDTTTPMVRHRVAN